MSEVSQLRGQPLPGIDGVLDTSFAVSQRPATVWYDVLRTVSWALVLREVIFTKQLQASPEVATVIIAVLLTSAEALIQATQLFNKFPQWWRIRLGFAVNIVNALAQVAMQFESPGFSSNPTGWTRVLIAVRANGIIGLFLSTLTSGLPYAWRRLQLALMAGLGIANARFMCQANASLLSLAVAFDKWVAKNTGRSIRLFAGSLADVNAEEVTDISICAGWHSVVMTMGYIINTYICWILYARMRRNFTTGLANQRPGPAKALTVSTFLADEATVLLFFCFIALSSVIGPSDK